MASCLIHIRLPGRADCAWTTIDPISTGVFAQAAPAQPGRVARCSPGRPGGGRDVAPAADPASRGVQPLPSMFSSKNFC